MSYIKKVTGMVVINDVEDDEVEELASPTNNNSKRKKKNQPNDPLTQAPQDPMADLTEEARTQKQKELDYKKKPSCLDIIFYDDKLRIIYVILLCLLLGLVIPYLLGLYAFHETIDCRGYCGLNVSYRIHCLPGKSPMNVDVCPTDHCCYDEVVLDDPNAPLCFHTIPPEYRYNTNNTVTEGNSITLDLLPLQETTPAGLKSLGPLRVLIQEAKDVVRIKIWDPSRTQDISDDFEEYVSNENQLLNVEFSDNENGFSVNISRADTGEEIFNSIFGPLIYSEDYIEITTRIPTYHLYGLGQRGKIELHPYFDERERWALFNINTNSDDDHTYGSHPFYMNFEQSGQMHGVYLHNSAPVEIGVYPIPAVAFRALGGYLDLRIFAGPTPSDVTRQYMDTLGQISNSPVRPPMPPYWALGYHLCRTSADPDEFQNVADGMEENELPYESDCVDARLNSVYPEFFTKLSTDDAQRVKTLKERGRKFWLTQYPFVTPENPVYEAAKDYLLKLSVTENATEENYYGKVNNKAVAYPDFFNDDIVTGWMGKDPDIEQLYDEADGILLFQNSPLNEANLTYGAWINYELEGSPCNKTYPENCCPMHPMFFLPNGISDVNKRTLCSYVVHSIKNDSIYNLQVHNAYGLYHHRRIYEFKRDLNVTKRPLVTSQSTHPLSTAFGGHFGGNYGPNFVGQQQGLVHILQMGLYGVPLTGVPVCGSVNDKQEDLRTEWCLRGHQAAAFLPFMMSHYEYGSTPRNPPNFSGGFAKQLEYYIRQRYMMIPYIYTLFYEASNTGTPVVRPLFYEFPKDNGSRSVNDQFLLGPVLMVSPAFNSVGDGVSVNRVVHFPGGCWYEFYTGTVVSNTIHGEDMVIPTLLTDINVHQLEKTILPMQGNLHVKYNTTSDTRQMNFTLVVALPCESESPTTTTTTTTTPAGDQNYTTGNLYMDDGETPLDQITSSELVTFKANVTSLTIQREVLNEIDPCLEQQYSTIIEIVRVFGIAKPITNVTVDGEAHTNFTLDSGALYIYGLNVDWCSSDSQVIWWE